MTLPSVDNIEPLQLPENGSHEVEIVHASAFTSQKGRPCLRLMLQLPGEEDVDDVSTVVFYPADDDDPKQHKKMASGVKKFYRSFGLSDGMDPDDMIGARGTARIKRVEKEGEEQADVKGFE